MALQISGPGFVVTAGLELREIPEDWAQDLERVSLMCNDMTEIKAGISPRCPKFSTLMLQENRLRKIPGSFLLQMCALKVVDLSRNELQALKELDLGGTGIEEAPESMANLVNLKVLYMDCLKENVVVGEEILHQMRDLEKFVGRFRDVRRFPSRLNAYSIIVGSGNVHDFDVMQRYSSRAVILKGCSVNTEILVYLPPNIEYLNFHWCHDLRALPCGTFSSLKVLKIGGCPSIKKLFTRGLLQQYLPSLETIRVWECEQMEEIVAGEDEGEVSGTFSSLKVLRIGG
ncbi:probable disease resistance protein At4g14610 [Malania oleifera]|uniref:probable disease resistance protein At4g14610 n=1 Tax=Malania oleifera TaxID=397392 RepID=UPI0025ADB339|nr:probable disease resistance protein At4g14610 [Malania oleifera]